MNWTRRVYVFWSVVISMVIAGCFGGSSSIIVDWTTVDIEIANHYDIPAGTYSIPFSIDEIIELAGDYDVEIAWSITRNDQQPVSHTANQFIVEVGVTYTAIITVTIEDDLYTYSKEITITAIEEMISITWDYNLDAGTQAEITTHPINSVITPHTAPTQNGYTFLGWFSSLESLSPFEFSTVLGTDMTFYAKWDIEVDASLHTEYFTNVSAINGSYIHDGHPFQHLSLQATLLYDDYDLAEEVDEYGMIYSQSTSLTWGNESVKISLSPDYWLNHIGYVHLESTSLPLDDLSTYYARPYVRYDHSVYYGEIVSYETDILVPSGQSEGLLTHVSGGTYFYDRGSTTYNSMQYIEFSDEYDAYMNNQPLSNYQYVSRQGNLHLVMVKKSDESRYLHVLHVTHRTTPAKVVFSSMAISSTYISEIERTTLKATYDAEYIKGSSIEYDFDHAGVLYSTTHPFLTHDQHGVTRLPSTNVDQFGRFSSDDYFIIPLGAERVYVRGYVVEDERISYADKVIVFEPGIEGWERVGTYQWDKTELKPTASHGISTSSSAVTRVTTFTPELTYQDIIGSFDVTGPGIKYITTPSSSYLYIHEMVFDHPTLVVEGVENNMVYNHPVTISFEDWNVDAYLQVGDNQLNFASGVTITEPGIYTLSLYHISGDISISFTVIE